MCKSLDIECCGDIRNCPIIEIDEKAFNEVIKGYLEGLKAIQNGERTSNDTD